MFKFFFQRVRNLNAFLQSSCSGIRVNDVINKINEIDASTLTLRDCQEIIQQCGRHLKIYVQG